MAFRDSQLVRQVIWHGLNLTQRFTGLMGMWGTTAWLARYMGDLAIMWHAPDKAERILKRGVELAKRKKNPTADLRALSALEELYEGTQEAEKRFQVLLKKIEVRDKLKDNYGKAEELSKIAGVYLSRAMYDKALTYAQRAQEACPEDAPAQLHTHLLIQQASAIASLGKFKQAEALLLQAIARAPKETEPSLFAFAKHELSMLYMRNGQAQEAVQMLSEAIKALKGTGNETLEAILFDDLSEIFISAGSYRRAISTLQQALVRWRRGINIANAVQSCLKLARLHARFNEFETAYEVLGEMVKYCQMTGRFGPVEELKREAKKIMQDSPDAIMLGSGFDRMVSAALVDELDTTKYYASRFGFLHKLTGRKKLPKAEQTGTGAEREEERSVQIYELSETYVKSLLTNLRKKS